jgi:hypothetical protein
MNAGQLYFLARSSCHRNKDNLQADQNIAIDILGISIQILPHCRWMNPI